MAVGTPGTSVKSCRIICGHAALRDAAADGWPKARCAARNTVADGPWLGTFIVVPLMSWPVGIIVVLVATPFAPPSQAQH